MLPRRQHSEDLIDVIEEVSFYHSVTLEVINVQMKLYRLVFVMIGIVITTARLERKPVLGPTLADPAIRVGREFKSFGIAHGSDRYVLLHREARKYTPIDN